MYVHFMFYSAVIDLSAGIGSSYMLGNGGPLGAPDIQDIQGVNADMMRLKVKKSGEGLHPSEVFVSVETKGGEEELAIDPKSLRGDTISVGWPVGQEGSYVLVELPRPTSRGYRRVWVQKHELVSEKASQQTA